MKRVIDGKVYNTETAEEVADASARCPRSDFQYWEETLYRTKKGVWFLYGKGGPMTHYAKSIDQNSYSGSDGLRALTDAEALEWMERHQIEADTVQRYFADLEEA